MVRRTAHQRQDKFYYTSPGAHTTESRGTPSPARAVAKAIAAVYDVPLPPIVEGLGIYKLPVLNVGTLGGGTVTSAAPREAWFTIDLRSLDTETQSRLEQEVIAIARRTAEQEGVGFRLEQAINIDFSKARPQQERLNHPLVQTAVAVVNHLRRPGTPAVVAQDIGSTDANIAVSMGIPGIAIGAATTNKVHTVDESADATTIVRGIKSFITLAVALTTK